MRAKQHAVLGLFFLGVVAVLAWFTLFQSDFRVGGEARRVTVWLEDAGGIRSGDSVLVAGVRWGKVDRVRYDASTEDLQRRIQVDLVLDQDVALYGDHRIEVDATVLGGKNLSIEPGAPRLLHRRVARDHEARRPRSPGRGAGGEPRLRTTGAETMVDDVNAGGASSAPIPTASCATPASAVANVEATFEDLSQVTERVAAGEGTLEALYDQALAQQIESAVANVDGLLVQARPPGRAGRQGDHRCPARGRGAGQRPARAGRPRDHHRRFGRRGTIGKLLTDPKVADDRRKASRTHWRPWRGPRSALPSPTSTRTSPISADLRTFSSRW